MYWVLFFFILGIRDFMDAKPLFKNNDIDCLSADIRKKYRHRRGGAFFLCSAVAVYIFVFETIYGIKLGFRSAFIYWDSLCYSYFIYHLLEEKISCSRFLD